MMSSFTDTASSVLISSLQNSVLYPHPVQTFDVLETHISWVLLTGSFAYKIKKPVNFGFVDFSTLAKRRTACLEELRLNRRLAPDLYLDVVPISGTPENPNLTCDGPVLDYAVKMRQFPQQALLTHVLERGELRETHLDQLTHDLADFHHRIGVANERVSFGNPEIIRQAVLETADQVPSDLHEGTFGNRFNSLKVWMEQAHAVCLEDFRKRKDTGRIRECHGDLHLGNMVLMDDRITVFDGIDFNESLRWIDVFSEVAFLLMDLQARGRSDLAARFVNHYLEWTGDYHGLRVLRYYEIYRALVRAKVACLRLTQKALSPQNQRSLRKECDRYFNLAERLAQPSPVGLIITHGLSGSGKTVISQIILQEIGAIRIRSDVERKRVFGLKPDDRSGSPVAGGMYTHEATEATYQRLHTLANIILDSGFPVVVDATFLHRRHRDSFRDLAKDRNVPFYILAISANENVLRTRLGNRHKEGTDASEATEAILDLQLAESEPLEPDERPSTICVSSEPLSKKVHGISCIDEALLKMMEKFRS